ncbi:MAG: hypothetical protein OXI63_05065, partial [Candidatus Poribacteria bacterium]|nr:hypothetical protein [Candidatus Poribacteria bacterium]
MYVKKSVHSEQRYFVKNPQFLTIILILLVMQVWSAQPVNALVGAVENGLVAYWSFNKDTVKIKTEATDVLSGLVAAVHGDPELAPASDCKVGECILFDGSVDRFLVEDSKPPKIDRD